MTEDIPRYSYFVASNETVTVRVDCVSTGRNCSAALDGDPLFRSSKDPLLYHINVTEQKGDVLAFVFSGTFVSNPPKGACYNLYVQGSVGGPEFDAGSLLPTDSTSDLSLAFTVS